MRFDPWLAEKKSESMDRRFQKFETGGFVTVELLKTHKGGGCSDVKRTRGGSGFKNSSRSGKGVKCPLVEAQGPPEN